MGIKNFTDLNTWQKAHKLVLRLYAITKKFPKTETFALTDQILRAGVSITSNIAEGFGWQGNREKIQFYYLAQSSLAEVQNQLIIARDVKYLPVEEFGIVWNKTIIVHKMLTGLIKSLKKS